MFVLSNLCLQKDDLVKGHLDEYGHAYLRMERYACIQTCLPNSAPHRLPFCIKPKTHSPRHTCTAPRLAGSHVAWPRCCSRGRGPGRGTSRGPRSPLQSAHTAPISAPAPGRQSPTRGRADVMHAAKPHHWQWPHLGGNMRIVHGVGVTLRMSRVTELRYDFWRTRAAASHFGL